MAVLHWADYVVCVVFLAVSLGIGVYHAMSGGRQRTISEFIMADRKLRLIPTVFSLIVSILSGSFILGMINEMYVYGATYLVWTLFASFIGFTMAQFFVAWLHPLQLTSAYEYHERRFKSRATRATASFLGVLSTSLYIGGVIYAPSTALKAVSSIPLEVSVPVMSLIATCYTALGGMKAVIWTDLFQGLVMLIGLLVIMIRGWFVVDPSLAFSLAKENGRLDCINGSLNPQMRHSTFCVAVGMTTHFMYQFGTNQSSVQRYSAIPKVKTARIMILLGMAFFVLLSVIVGIIGITVFSFFADKRCDPLKNGDITNYNQVMPYFVLVAFEDFKGFTGLLLAILYSGALSSISSSFSGCAANIWEDFLKYYLSSRISEFSATLLNKIIVVVVGVAGMSVAFLFDTLPGTVLQISMALVGVCGGPLFGMLLLGGTSRTANWLGALVGGWCAFFLNVWIVVGARVNNVRSISLPLPPVDTDGCHGNATFFSDNSTTPVMIVHPQESDLDNFFMISYLWYIPLGIVVVQLIGRFTSFVSSYFFPSLAEEPVDEACLIQWRKIFALTWDPYLAPKCNNEYTEDKTTTPALEPMMELEEESAVKG